MLAEQKNYVIGWKGLINEKNNPFLDVFYKELKFNIY